MISILISPLNHSEGITSLQNNLLQNNLLHNNVNFLLLRNSHMLQIRFKISNKFKNNQ